VEWLISSVELRPLSRDRAHDACGRPRAGQGP
jgi:hypothetical protein